MDETVAKDSLAAETAEILQLRKELQDMSRELLDTREQLERLKQDVGSYNHNVNVVNPEKFEVS